MYANAAFSFVCVDAMCLLSHNLPKKMYKQDGKRQPSSAIARARTLHTECSNDIYERFFWRFIKQSHVGSSIIAKPSLLFTSRVFFLTKPKMSPHFLINIVMFTIFNRFESYQDCACKPVVIKLNNFRWCSTSIQLRLVQCAPANHTLEN